MNETEVLVITPAGVFFHGSVRSVTIRGAEGYLGIYYDHAPLVTPVVPGRLSLKPADGEIREASVSDGLLEVMPDRVKILVDYASWIKGNTYP